MQRRPLSDEVALAFVRSEAGWGSCNTAASQVQQLADIQGINLHSFICTGGGQALAIGAIDLPPKQHSELFRDR